MSYGPSHYQPPEAKNVMEHIGVLFFYQEDVLAGIRLRQIAANFKDKKWIEKKEKTWLTEDQYWNDFRWTDWYE